MEQGGWKYKDEMENKTLEAFMCFYSERTRKARYKLGHIHVREREREREGCGAQGSLNS